MVLTPSQTRALYRRRAPHYDRLVGLLGLSGARVSTYRRRAVEALSVSPGDTVVDLGCGTGRNFLWLERAVTDSGRIVGVDLTDAMLRQARHRVESAGWANVDLVESDAGDYELPGNIGGVLSTFAMTMFDDYDGVIQRAAEALRPGGRLAILEMKRPAGRPEWMVRFGAWLLRPIWSEPRLCRANALGISQAAPGRGPVPGVLRRRHLPLGRTATFVTRWVPLRAARCQHQGEQPPERPSSVTL